MVSFSTNQLVLCSLLLPFIRGDYPPNGTYFYDEHSREGYFQVMYTITFPQHYPHMVRMDFDCWGTMGLGGTFFLKDYDVPEGCSLDFKDETEVGKWKWLRKSIAAAARRAHRTMNKGDLETLITKTDSGGQPYVELTFNKTKLHLRVY
ncbi:hypothetical protein FOL47_009219 [Perkinsus chesapeaki]|uniref:Uncharacterized protein n=1 Tax=Perkinsus chesapeaki TaxID=330153 RepID=A0A7J6L9K7_PERCH|nr:hypothetical protein FOL47_009219 [Perkinsus chesapeaki]